jgi:uncharacterized protein YkwD
MDIIASLILFVSHAISSVNFLDIIIALIIVFYIHEGYSLGFTLAFLDLLSFIISFIAALKFYALTASVFMILFGMPIGIANALTFFIIAVISEIILSILTRRFTRHLPQLPRGRIAKIFQAMNHWLGIIPGLLSAFIVLSFLLSIIVTFPSSPPIKQAVTNSVIGIKLLENTSFFESHLNDIFGGALNETLNFLTIEPKSTETVKLHFTLTDGITDGKAEQEMFQLVNKERMNQGLDPLSFDTQLSDVARKHSNDMLVRGYFSHYTPEGKSPFERMDAANIAYEYAGENLALAPSTSLAMQGLMNSPGHRANILSPNFHKIGIGTIDGGIYGKMYSQEFTD